MGNELLGRAEWCNRGPGLCVISAMRTPLLRILLIAAIAGGAACAKKSASDAMVDSAIKQYKRVRSGMSKRELTAMLGEPSKVTHDRFRWEVVGRPDYSAALEVKFDAQDRVTSIAQTRSHD